MIKSIVFALVIGVVLSQATNVCSPACADCRTDLGNTACYACYKSSIIGGQCTGPALDNCLIANSDGKCSTCLPGFALDTDLNSCATKSTVNGCILEFVDTGSNKCVVCNGSYP